MTIKFNQTLSRRALLSLGCKTSLVLVGCGGGGGGGNSLVNGGVVTTFAGTPGVPGFFDASPVLFHSPVGVAVDSSGNVFVAENGNHTIRKITSSGTVSTIAGDGIAGYTDTPGIVQFNSPGGLAVDSLGNIFVADTNNHLIRKISTAGVAITTTLAGNYNVGGYVDNIDPIQAEFLYPTDVAIDSLGNLFIADSGNHSIRKITPAGVTSTFAGAGPNFSGFSNGRGTAAQFSTPTKIAIDSANNIYVSDYDNHSIRKITPDGDVTTLAGSPNSGYLDASGTLAQFSGPSGLTVDLDGNVYVADTGNNLIRKISSLGVVTTLAGDISTPAFGFSDGTGTSAQFFAPNGISVDSSGTLFVADTSNNLIRKIV